MRDSLPPNGTGDDRDRRGRFTKGNAGGPGNPHARSVAKLRSAMLRTVGSDDIAGIIRAMVDAAVSGDVAAARLVLDHTIGKPKPMDDAQDGTAVPLKVIVLSQDV